MPIFSDASNLDIRGGQFIDIGVQQNVYGSSGIDHLLRGASLPEAALDSEARHPAPSCFPGTREQYIEDITNWATASIEEQPLSVYWMKGPAGVGKTALAQTCAERLQLLGHFGAAFFFSVNERDDHTRLFTTLAYQLSVELPEFREAVERALHRDKALTTKTIAVQFKCLISGPLMELQRMGKWLGRRVIFIDGLDECKSPQARHEIVDLIASFAQERSTPLRWAIFSRPEPHIEAAFAKYAFASLCHINLLPISREADAEIETYLRGGFSNILRRRNLTSSCAWPSDDDIRKLVEAASGLFIYAAAVLRFIDSYPSLTPDEPLRAVLSAMQRHTFTQNIHGHAAPFAELDALYTVIMRQVPEHALPSVQLLLAYLLHGDFIGTWSAVYISNSLGFSQIEFQGVCNLLPAVIQFLPGGPEITQPPEAMDVDRSTEQINEWTSSQLLDCGGSLMFYHKSFYDYLGDPIRSGEFCVNAPTINAILFDHLVGMHSRFTESYNIWNDTPVSNNGARLPWPLTNDLVNSHLHYLVLVGITTSLLHDLERDFKELPISSLRALANLDYCKSHFAARQLFTSESTLFGSRILSCPALSTVIRGTLYTCITPDWMSYFDDSVFRRIVKKFEKAGVIKPHFPSFTWRWKSIFPGRVESGLYTLGKGDKAIYWYWECDTERGYYHEFRTTELMDALRTYFMRRLALWKE